MWQPVLMISGYFISVLGLAMLFPAALDVYDTGNSWSPFFSSSIIALFLGMSMFLANKIRIDKVSLQQGYLLTVVSWFSVTLIASIPFILHGTVENWADAVFEASSGISTTGATIITNLDHTPRAILLWRAILNGLGGIGIVIFAIAMLPFLGIGGMQIFQHENSDFNDKLMPKISYIAKRIIFIYITMVVACLICLYLAGMNWFDALCHALATIATGGMSTKDASIGYFDSAAIDAVITVFMVLGAIPLTLYHTLLINKSTNSLRVEQVRFFIKLLVFYIGVTSLWLVYVGKYDFIDALRYASFNIVSITTTTGFASTDYLQWGAFASTIFVIFALTGGCTGSTAGSVKIFRWQVVIAFLKKSLTTAIEPNRVVPIKIGRLSSDNALVNSVFVFLSAYVFSLLVLTVLIAVTGIDFDTAFGSVIACITNSGPSISPVTGPAGNYSSLSSYCKYILSFAMLLGRLDVLTVVVLFSRSFWRN